jgi:histidinol-phosphatase (PHP family)
MASPSPVTWIRKDYHVHESHSSDAPGATVEKYCRTAERRGIDEIAFTTHLILTGPDVAHGVSPEKIPEYLDEIEAARGDTTVELRSGLEVDYFPEVEKRIETVLDEHSLDFVLGSLHYIRGIDIGSRRNSPRFFAGRPLEESLDIYFDGFREAIESGLFDAMAHPDYFRKYLHLTRPEPATWEEYGTTIYEALDSLRSHGVGISVNSSGWRHGIGDVYPIRGLLEAANKAGVEKVTVGSDCHSIEDLGVNTLKAVRRLEEAGYSHLCVFEKRRNRKVSLTDVIDVKPRINLIP